VREVGLLIIINIIILQIVVTNQYPTTGTTGRALCIIYETYSPAFYGCCKEWSLNEEKGSFVGK